MKYWFLYIFCILNAPIAHWGHYVSKNGQGTTLAINFHHNTGDSTLDIDLSILINFLSNEATNCSMKKLSANLMSEWH